MAYLSDIEIAQKTKLKPIQEIAEIAGVESKYLEQYGNYKAKVDLSLLKESKRQNGKLVLVTAITPTPGRSAGTSPMTGTTLITTTEDNSVLTLRNPAENATSLTLTPYAGGNLPASAHLVILRLA